MKIKVKKEAYFNQRLVKIGEILDFKGKKLPSWATLADGIETKKANKEKVAKQENKDDVQLNDEQKQQYLEMLLNDAIEKDILIDNSEKKTIDEQIKELEEKLKGKE